MDDLGAPRPFRFGLRRDRPNHALVEINVLDFDVGHLDAPCLGVLVEYFLNIGVELVALGKHVVQFVTAQYRAQRCLGQLTGGLDPVFHLNNGPFRVQHAKIDHRADFHRDIVPGDHILGGDIHDDCPQVDANHLLNARDDDDQAGPLDLPETAKQEDDAALVLAQNLDRAEDEQCGCGNEVGGELEKHGSSSIG